MAERSPPLIRVQGAPFDTGAELADLQRRAGRDCGGVASFLGTVRASATDDLAALHLEHYPGMTETALAGIAGEATARFGLLACTIIHRIGRLEPGAPIVLAAAAAAHRRAALSATELLIDVLKTSAPFWKCEEFADGRRVWVEARETDEAAATAWAESGRTGLTRVP